MFEKLRPQTSASYPLPTSRTFKKFSPHLIGKQKSCLQKKAHKKKGALPAPFLSNQTLTILLRDLETHLYDAAVF